MTRGYWDKRAEKYSRSPIADEAAYQKKLEITRGYFRPDMEVLEIGCGTGGTAILHAPHVRHITALDFSRSMLDIAEERAKAAGVGNVSFEVADIASYDVPDASYDMVMAMSLLHLLKEPEPVIGRIHGMLKPGGYFISSTACLGDSMLRALKYAGPVGRAVGLLPDVTVFGEADLVRMIEGQGFAIEHRWQPKKMAAVFVVARKAE